MSKPVKQFSLPVSILTFTQEFWLNESWFSLFLSEQLCDIEIKFTPWTNDADGTKSRTVFHKHPLNMSFYGLPSHTASTKLQKLAIDDSVNEVRVFENNSFKGYINHLLPEQILIFYTF